MDLQDSSIPDREGRGDEYHMDMLFAKDAMVVPADLPFISLPLVGWIRHWLLKYFLQSFRSLVTIFCSPSSPRVA